jgi:hypothetical protein
MPSEPLPPCPSCGGGARPGYRLGHNPGNYPYCGECHFSVAPDAWRRLSDAVALAAAVEAIGQEIEAHQGRSIMFWYIPVRGADDAVRYRPELFMSNNRYVHDLGLAAALRALAGEGENHA